MDKIIVSELKAKRIFAGPGNYAYVAEAEVFDDATGDTVFVAVQKYAGGYECTVSKESVYAFLAENSGEPAGEFLEEYGSAQETKASEFAKVFDALRKAIGVLG